MAAVGANAIGTAGENSSSLFAQGSVGYGLAHAALGCAVTAAENEALNNAADHWKKPGAEEAPAQFANLASTAITAGRN
ncbi:hypothetical protein [Paraburkholderia tropica]|uniref:hypothetical protein n=1 Tax=Paraburkholderia tropica TaxID=92647 RepID=UPI0015E8BB43|nr:hypothetical protein G5S35_37100 [Paraburkholderia tropica]